MRAQGRGLIRWCVAAAVMAAATLMICTQSGCGTSSADRVELVESTLAKYQEQAAEIDRRIPELQTMIADAERAMEGAKPGTLAKLRSIVAEARAKLDAAVAAKPDLDKAVETWSDRLAEISADPNVGWAGELEAAGAGMSAAAPLLGPYGWIASIAGGLALAVGAAFGTSQHRRAAKTTQALGEVVGGVSAWLRRTSTAEAEAIKEQLASRQSPQTQTLVHRLKPT